MTNDNGNATRIEKDNRVFIPEIIRILEEGHTVTIGLRGYSMRPFLEDRRDKALLRKATKIEKDDVVLAEIAPKRFALHRVISIDGDNVTLRGDGNIAVEHCKRSDIHGFAVGFYRKGSSRLESTSGRKWRIYSFIWTRLLPIRRYLLFAYKILNGRFTTHQKSTDPNTINQQTTIQ